MAVTPVYKRTNASMARRSDNPLVFRNHQRLLRDVPKLLQLDDDMVRKEQSKKGRDRQGDAISGSGGDDTLKGGSAVDPRVIDTIIAEAVGDGPDAMQAVAFAIANRMQKSGKTAYEVVSAPSQFEGFSNPGPGVKGAINDPAIRAQVEQLWQAAETRSVPDPLQGGTMFHAKSVTPYWAEAENRNGTKNIGGQVFYLGTDRTEPVGPNVPPRPNRDTATAALETMFGGEPSPATGSGLATLTYTNQNKQRNLEVNPVLAEQLVNAVTQVYGPGYQVELFSGAQGEGSRGTTGSRRHTTAVAGDVWIKDPSGRTLGEDEMVPLGQYWLANNIGSVGLSSNNAGKGTHLDLIGGNTPASVPLQKGEGRFWFYGGGTKEYRTALTAGIAGANPKNLRPPADIPQASPGQPVPTPATASPALRTALARAPAVAEDVVPPMPRPRPETALAAPVPANAEQRITARNTAAASPKPPVPGLTLPRVRTVMEQAEAGATFALPDGQPFRFTRPVDALPPPPVKTLQPLRTEGVTVATEPAPDPASMSPALRAERERETAARAGTRIGLAAKGPEKISGFGGTDTFEGMGSGRPNARQIIDDAKAALTAATTAPALPGVDPAPRPVTPVYAPQPATMSPQMRANRGAPTPAPANQRPAGPSLLKQMQTGLFGLGQQINDAMPRNGGGFFGRMLARNNTRNVVAAYKRGNQAAADIGSNSNSNSNSSSSDNSSSNSGTITGSATGQIYNVGQTYQAANGFTYTATPDGFVRNK